MTGPEHYAAAERLLAQVKKDTESSDALVLAQLATGHALLAQSPHSQTEPSAAVSALPCFYRAAHGPVPLGVYTTQDAARMHCEADALDKAPERDGGIFEWLGDESEPDDPYELVIAKDGAEEATDYTVSRVVVATEYDPEADA